jgi:hypothetical protein
VVATWVSWVLFWFKDGHYVGEFPVHGYLSDPGAVLLCREKQLSLLIAEVHVVNLILAGSLFVR